MVEGKTRAKKKRIYRSSLTTLKVIRRLRGMTLVELSEKSGLDPSYLSLLEHGDRRINTDLINPIANALKIEASILLDEFPYEVFDTYIDRATWRSFFNKLKYLESLQYSKKDEEDEFSK